MKRRDLLPLLATVPTATARAQPAPAGSSWSPDRLVRFVVGFAPGGSTDTTARVVAQGITAGLGQPVVVENRTGAAGNVATEHVARSAPDGHTLIVASMGSHATNAALYRDLPFDVVRDFVPVSLVALSACLLVVHPSLPVRSVAELVARAKASPGALNCGIAGAGSSQHFAAALFEHRAGVRFTQVSYRGGAPAVTDLVAGNLDLIVSNLPECIGQLRAGRLRGLAITDRQRHRLVPDIPTVEEAGAPDLLITNWTAVLTNAAVPPPVLRRLEADALLAMRDPELVRRAEEGGFDVLGWDAARSGAHIHAEVERWGRLVAEAGIRAD